MCDITGFLIYVTMMIMLHWIILNKRKKVSIISVFILISIVAAYRGLSGVDTYLYTLRFEHLESFKDISFIEPFIPLLMNFIKKLGGSFSDFSLLYGMILSGLYFYIFRKIPNSIYFGLAMFPVIYIDSLFNGVRIGLAYPLIFLSIVYSSFSLFLFAVSSHISSLIIVFFRIIPYKYIFVFIILFVIGIYLSHLTLFDLFSERYMSKYNSYQEMYTRNIYSGVADSSLLFISLVIYLRILGVKGKSLLKKILLIFFLISMFHLFLVSKYIFMLRITRILDIIVFAFIAREKKKIDKFALYLSFIIGILYSLNFLRQINSTCAYEIGGFLPLNFGLF